MSFLLLGLIVAVSLFSVAMIYSFKGRLNEESKKREALEEKLSNKIKENQKIEQSFKTVKQEILNLKQDKKKIDLKEKKQAKLMAHKVSEEVYGQLEKEFTEAKSSFASQKERLEEQIEVLVKQLKGQDREIVEFKGNYELERKSQQALNKEALELRKKYERLDKEQKKRREKQDKLLLESKEQKNLLQRKEQEYEKLKKKLKQYHSFYVTMLSQKNMLEERLGNWEKALKSLSYWVLKQENINPKLKGEEALGELVSSALEITGLDSLVEDEFSTKHEKDNNVLRFEQR